MSCLGGVWAFIRSHFFNYELQMDITIVGLPNAGKTSFVRALKGLEYRQDMLPTISMELTRCHINNRQLLLNCFDFSGQQRFNSMWRAQMLRSQLIVYVIDISDDLTLEESRRSFIELVLYNEKTQRLPVLVIGNKLDMGKNFLETAAATTAPTTATVTPTVPEDKVVKKKKSILPIDKLPNTVRLLDKSDVLLQFLGISIDDHNTSLTVKTGTVTSYGSTTETQKIELHLDIGVFVTSLKTGENFENIVDWILEST